jgi:serine/threonine protein kinase
MIQKGERLGRGTFGIVYQCNMDSENLAIKRNIKDIDTDFICVIRELDLLNKLRDHPNILSLYAVSFGSPFSKQCLSPLNIKNYENQKDDMMHFIFPEASCDLNDYIYRKTPPNFEHMKNFMIDILLGVQYMHKKGIIHRDLKPSNILIFNKDTPNAMAQLCDFGLSKPYTKQGPQTPGVATTCYRAPELIISKDYDYKIDIWAIACIFYEMISKKNYSNVVKETKGALLSEILKKLDPALPEKDIQKIKENKKIKLATSYNPKVRKTLEKQIGLTVSGIEKFNKEAGSFSSFCDLLRKMFVFYPIDRYTIDQTIQHSFFDTHQYYVEETYRSISFSEIEYPMYILDCLERKWVAKLATKIFNQRYHYTWYSHRILFQALSMMDRHLWYMAGKEETKATTSVHKGRFYDKDNTETRFMTCVYMSIKYFSSLVTVANFRELAKDLQLQSTKLIAEKFESDMLTYVFEYDVYRNTIYEMADEKNHLLTDNQIRDLIILYTNNHSFSGMLPSKMLGIYLDILTTKPLSELIIPIDFTIY